MDSKPLEKRTILAGWLIDGTGAAAAENIRFTIEAGRIVSIDPEVTDVSETGNSCLDFSEYTLLPPLYDCHTHLAISGTLDSEYRNTQGSLAYEALESIITGHVQDYLEHGVLSVRDGGDRHGDILRYKKDFNNPNRIPFGLRTAGIGWHREGRYGKFIGRAVFSGADVVREIEAWIGRDIDHVKILQSGINSLSTFGKQTEPQFEKDEITRIFRFCRSRGIGLMIHANGEKPVDIAIEGGCDSIEHGFFMGNENLQKMADNRITWVPTAVTMKAYADNTTLDGIGAEVALRTLEHQMEQLFSARKYGVPVALGTDAGSPGVYHGKAVGEELRLLVSAGYSIEEAIACATANAAVLLKSEMPGRLMVGGPASFVAVKGSPFQVPERLSGISKIMVSGNMIEPDFMQSRKERKEMH